MRLHTDNLRTYAQVCGLWQRHFNASGGEMSALATQENFSSKETSLAVVETSSMAMSAQSKAMVESRYVMALRNPRDMDQVRLDIMKECNRPYFAQSAYYVKPIGKGVEGLSIRFVEAALRCMKNVLIESSMIFEDQEKEIHRVSVTDLETNVTYPMDVKITKSVERSKPSEDGTYISVRKNSFGKMTYTVPGTDDDLLNKRGALISKAIRTLGLRIIPGDLCDEAEEIIKKLRASGATADPDAERKRIVDAFSKIGVSAKDLGDYLGHSLAQCSPAQIVNLRGLYTSIKDGEATWKEVMDNKELTSNDKEIQPETQRQTAPQVDVYADIKAEINAAETKEELDEIMAGIPAIKQPKIKASYQARLDVLSKQ